MDDLILALICFLAGGLGSLLLSRSPLLATLSGQAPGSAVVPSFTLDEFKLPVDLPVVLPSELVRRRPDIQAAEALLTPPSPCTVSSTMAAGLSMPLPLRNIVAKYSEVSTSSPK